MSRRKLSRQQLNRIQENQQAQAERLNPDVSRPDDTDRQLRGLVISHFGQQLDIEPLEGDAKGSLVRCYQRSNIEPLVAGDEVIWEPGDPEGVVVAVMPRKSVLCRPSKLGALKPVAANIDTLIIVIAPQPEPHFNLIDRYLVAAGQMGAEAVLLLNKCDLILDAPESALVSDMLALYRKLGYQTHQLSCRTGFGRETLLDSLSTRTSVVVGQSGVGKSALVNLLLPGIRAEEGALSEAITKGRHTTTAARLYHFSEGGRLIDSPGIREFGLWHIEPAEILANFVEFCPFLGLCRFRDCRHEDEPGCALLQAVAEGRIDARRLHSYQFILRSRVI
jgi:ribosome biogenesis GTPase